MLIELEMRVIHASLSLQILREAGMKTATSGTRIETGGHNSPPIILKAVING
jgi:hypothetical protein